MKRDYTKIVMFLFVLAFTFSVKGQSELSKSKYAGIITSYLSSSENASKVSGSDLTDIYVNREVFSKKTGIANVYLNQRYNGIKIYNAITAVGIKNNKVFHFAEKFQKNIEERVTSKTPLLNESQAIEKAATYFKLGAIGEIQYIESEKGKAVFSKGAISQENIPVELVYTENEDGDLVLAWDLSIYTIESSHWWSVRVDARTGEIVNHNDWVISCNFDGNHSNHSDNHKAGNYSKSSVNLFKAESNSLYTPADGSQYNVYALPTESPFHGPRSIVTQPADATASPFGWHDTDGIAGAEYTITRGNNVWALDDINDNDGTDGFSPDGGASLNFDFPLNLDQNPRGYLDVSTVNLFYINNVMHDIWYQYGFDEASGNFQENNYGKGGAASDAVAAQSQDGGGQNNANFATPADGSAPRMQMYLWFAAGTPGDALIINNGSLAGGYQGFTASFGAVLSSPVTADLVVLTDDDGGESTDPNDACDLVTNAAALNGKIAVIRRGTCEFGVKMLAAENAGAIAALVVTDDREPGPMGPGAVGDQVTIPSIMIDKATGDAIIASLGNGDTINASLQDAGPYQRDGSFDNGVVAHEYGHGISTRLTGGADNSGCLNSNFQMGEGWSDWFGLMITMKPGDVGTTGRGIGTFDLNQPNDGLGIRLRRYSTDFAVNEYTFDATNDNTVEGQDVDGNDIIRNRRVHYIGTVWCTMLWDLTWAYVDKYGFDPDLYNGTGGNNRAMSVVIEGLKLQGCNPEFLEGRDGILAADMALTGGEDQCLIWDVFARRGLGVNASNGLPFRREDQVENFDTPDPADPSLANCTTLSAAKFNASDYSIFPNPASNLVTVKSKKDLGDVTLKLVDINGREVLTKRTSLIGEVELDVKGLQSGLYILNIKGDYIDTNEKIVIK
ncbi:peptidase [Algibacter marinivivus]|uniref:Peptidase n=1 Tax=Algibacter marinivivus TaxID=2100723 RepID=A0A2U2X8S4_9FLAO|nr:T9SS-dependent M36 family metallopeptidase [Algibacter marinivivus]PWH84143.1 peptidase [Algibacter marinivivus]